MDEFRSAKPLSKLQTLTLTYLEAMKRVFGFHRVLIGVLWSRIMKEGAKSCTKGVIIRLFHQYKKKLPLSLSDKLKNILRLLLFVVLAAKPNVPVQLHTPPRTNHTSHLNPRPFSLPTPLPQWHVSLQSHLQCSSFAPNPQQHCCRSTTPPTTHPPPNPPPPQTQPQNLPNPRQPKPATQACCST